MTYTTSSRALELLAPAKNLSCGIAAISHGADAVYIGADRFGARAAAGNSVEDIEMLCQYAHQYGAKVYVTVNTIIYENELDATQKLITDLSRIGVDALLVQDMATLEMRKVALDKVGHAPVLHASTQCDTRSVEKVKWLKSLGFDRAVLARELSLDEIKAIHEAVPDIELEVFVHGALCVSYSGQCYASQFLFGRSANRGECAQVCRMSYDLIDANGKTIVKDRYLMSMKDMCQIDYLEELADAGATSFKIEGRLKDEDYVKNVVSAYSQRLNAIVRKRSKEYHRSSWGKVEYRFQPDLNKTFNRGYTNYFLKGRQHEQLATMNTPKALGEFVGHVKELRKDSFNVAGTAAFANGDGLCFINQEGELEGFRVNRAVGNRLYPFRMSRNLKHGIALYRNNDTVFEKTLSGDTAHRMIPIDIAFGTTEDGFVLAISPHIAKDNSDNEIVAVTTTTFAHEKAQKPQTDNIRKQLSKLGGTIFETKDITIEGGADRFFVPSSILAAMRRKAIEDLNAKMLKYHTLQQMATKREDVPNLSSMSKGNEKTSVENSTEVRYWTSEYRKYPYLYNVANHIADNFYKEHGLQVSAPAFEVNKPQEAAIMQCRYCIRYELGYCVRRGGKKPTWAEPLTLRLGDGHRFRLDFRCDECQMNLVVPAS